MNQQQSGTAPLAQAAAPLNTEHPSTPVLHFHGHEVRMLIGNDGQPRWIAADVATILGYSATAAMTRSLDEDEKGMHTLHTPGGLQDMVTITESGLYSAILRSRVPSAAEFRRWVTSEVLPTIRRTGSYGQPAARSDDEVLRDAFGILDRRVAALAAEKAALTPKAEAYDAFLDAGDALPMNAVAKALGIGANSLFAQLRDKKVLINGGARHNLPMQRYAHHFKVVAVEYVKPNGTRACSYTTKVRPSGVNFIRHTLDLPGAPGDLARPTSQSH